MVLHNIKITNFKSIYGSKFIDFDKMKGLIKLSGPIGSGKTTIAEAILYGMYGTVKGQNNTQLIAWNSKACEVEINLTSKNKDIHIIRNIWQPLIIEINGKTLSASNKRNTQQILEEEIFDVPKLAIIKMCVISFNAFNSLAAMNPNETKQFLDDIFGFKLFTDYNNEIVIERKTQMSENAKLKAIYDENVQQIEYLENKRNTQQQELITSTNIDGLSKQKETLINQGKNEKSHKDSLEIEFKEKEIEIDKLISETTSKMVEVSTLGKQEKSYYNTFKTGKCPTCGAIIDINLINEHKEKMLKYKDEYIKWQHDKEEKLKEKEEIKRSYKEKIDNSNKIMQDLKTEINKINNEVNIYNNNVQLINENYDDLIKEYNKKVKHIKDELDKSDIEIGEWNELNELFTKTLRYNLLETLIPHINKSIQFFINKLDQSYKIEYDQEFKAHIYVDSFDREISYNNLSTGQKKSLDLAIIFGILQNIIANVDFNVYILDELFSNMDSDTRNIMLSLLNETMDAEKSIFIINHAEMNDEYFKHKVRVSLQNKKIISASKKKEENVVVKASYYEVVF